MRFLLALAIIAACCLIYLALAPLSGIAFADDGSQALDPNPPRVVSGTAVKICGSIVAAGFSPYDYVKADGAWWWDPGWTSFEDARMSRLWRNTPECSVNSDTSSDYEGARILVSKIQVVTFTPAPTRSNEYVAPVTRPITFGRTCQR